MTLHSSSSAPRAYVGFDPSGGWGGQRTKLEAAAPYSIKGGSITFGGPKFGITRASDTYSTYRTYRPDHHQGVIYPGETITFYYQTSGPDSGSGPQPARLLIGGCADQYAACLTGEFYGILNFTITKP